MNIKTDTSPTDTNDPVRKDESIGDLQTVRSKQVDKALFVLLILGLPVLIATISRVVDIGWHPVEFFYCALYLVNLGTILFIKRLSFPVRISVLIGILFLLGISSLISFGLAANGILILATFSILISVLFGTKKGIIATGISLCMIGTIGVGVITGIITFAFDINNFVTSVTSWITAFAAFAFLIGIAVISSGAIQQYLANAFRELSKYRNQLEELVKARTAELSKSNEKLKQEMDEKKKTEETLRESEESLAMAQEVADVGSWDWKIKDDTLIWSDRTYRQFGLKPGEITPTYPAFEDFVHPDDRELINQRVEQALNEDKPYSVNARMVRTDGTEWIMHAQGVVYRGKDSEPIRFVGTQQDITHMVHAEEALRESERKYRQQSKVLEGINRVFREALTCESEKQVANTCLAVAEEISDSKFGLIGEKNPEGRFDTIAISNPGWDVCKMPDSEATRLIQDMEIRGIDRTTIREEKSRIVNDPTSHPDRIGPPEGHPPITSFLGVPLKHSGKTIGMIGLGNKESGYDLSDQKAIEDLSIAFVEALMRKRAEEALRKSELWLYNIFNSLEEAVLVVTPDRKLISLNRSGQKMFGYSQEELVGVSTEVFHVNHEHYGEFGNQINEAFDRGEAANFEFEAKRKNGEIFPTEHTVSFLKSDQGEPLGIVSIVRDISKRKHAEEALRESEEKFRTLVDNLPVGVYRNLPGPKGKFLMANPAFCKMFGFKNEEELKKVAPAELYANPEERQQYSDNLIEKGVIENDERTLMKRDGTPVHTSITSRVVYGKDGEVSHFDSIMLDITDRERLEAQLRQVYKMEAIATLAGGIAHEFNNALMGVMGNIELLKMELPEDERRDKYFEAMNDSGHRMSHLTDQLLAYARGGKYQARDLKLDDFTIETLPILQHDLSPEVRVETHFPKDISYIRADHAQMQMVLSAIVANSNEAIKGKGLIRIAAENKDIDEAFTKEHPGLKPGPYVCFTIEDEGTGMDEEEQEKIFEPFFTTKFQGRGMGMAAVYGIIKGHDGTITVESEPGKGTVVRIYLPAVEAKEEAKEVKQPKVEIAMGEGTILVIEDEESLVGLFREILERLGYRALLARTGKEAVELAKTFDGQIDLALLDVKLPDMDGGRVYPFIMEARPDLKVIVCSGYGIHGPVQDILDAGAEAFMQKPFHIAPFADKLKEVLEGK